ncbi:hypothetical protein D9M69_467680 [compost metagenome]
MTAFLQFIRQLSEGRLTHFIGLQQTSLRVLVEIGIRRGLATQFGPPFQHVAAAHPRDSKQTGDGRRKVFLDEGDFGLQRTHPLRCGLRIPDDPLHDDDS